MSRRRATRGPGRGSARSVARPGAEARRSAVPLLAGGLGVGAVVGAVIVLGTRGGRDPVPTAPDVPAATAVAPAPTATLAEFQAIAARLADSDQTYLGRAPARRIEARLATPALPPRDRALLLADLALERLELGEVDDAVTAIERVFDVVAGTSGFAAGPDLEYRRALVYLRQAEVENCVMRHNAECCIFPLRGGGVHTATAPAERAWDSLMAYLTARPDDLGARWLLNIVGMALGRYPRGMPGDLLVPMDRFAAATDVGRFVDIAPRLGVGSFNLCGGVIAEDMTGDGLIDIVTSSYDPSEPLHLYANSGDGRFIDASSTARLDDQLGGLNILGADYDNDGDVDILVLRGAWMQDDGRIRNSLLRNDGDGTFHDVTHAAGLAVPAYPTQAAVWADFDNDGDLDLFVGNESRALWDTTGHFPSQLFINQGDGTFVDRAAEAGVTNDGYAKGVAAGDYDNDGDVDLYVSNAGPNRLYRNDGGGVFTDVAPDHGLTAPAGRSFAAWFFDYDNDGWLDLFVGAFDADIADVAAEYLGLEPDGQPPCLYHNRGDGTFENVAASAGLARMFLPMGANFGDIDNDGSLDIYLTTGDPEYDTLMPNVMLRNTGAGRFEDVTRSTGLGHLQKGHGVAFADFDHDGDQDIYNQLGGFYLGDKFHNTLYLNPGHGHHFVTLELVGVTSNRMAYGARIAVTLDTPQGPRTLHRAVGAVSSFGGSPARQEIGLGAATAIARIEVGWPASGRRQTFEGVPVDSWVRIVEDRDELEILERRQIKWK